MTRRRPYGVLPLMVGLLVVLLATVAQAAREQVRLKVQGLV